MRVHKSNLPTLLGWALAITLVAFAAGTITGMGMGRGTFLTMVAKVAQLTSGAFERQVNQTIPGATNLNALEVIWEVREKIRQDFVYPIKDKDEKKLTYGAVRGMLAALDDPYTRFLDPDEYREFRTDSSGHFPGIGAVLEAKTDEKTSRQQVIVSSILPDGPAAKSPLRPQDIIVKVDQTLVDGLTLSQVVDLIRGPRGTPVTLIVVRKGLDKPLPITIVRAEIEVKVVKEFKMLDEKNKIGYVWLQSFNQNARSEMKDALAKLSKQGMKGLVFDLSYDPGGLLDAAVDIASLFIAEGPVAQVKSRGEQPKPLYATGDLGLSKDIPMVTLVDGGSASASEIVAGALQDTKRSTIVGHNSFGKSKVQTIVELQDDSAIFLTTALWLTPKLHDINQKDANGKRGLKPDIAFPEPDPNAELNYKEWHERQVELARDALLKLMAK